MERYAGLTRATIANVLPPVNTDGGFFAAVKGAFGNSSDAMKVWNTAFDMVLAGLKATEKDARGFLDSHFGDELARKILPQLKLNNGIPGSEGYDKDRDWILPPEVKLDWKEWEKVKDKKESWSYSQD